MNKRDETLRIGQRVKVPGFEYPGRVVAVTTEGPRVELAGGATRTVSEYTPIEGGA